MGDMADEALDRLMDVDEEQQNLIDIQPEDMSDDEIDFLYDSDGTEFPKVF